MKTLIAAVLLCAACHHEPEPQAAQAPLPPTAAAEGVDPTLPSWAPNECAAYHAAVVKLAHCNELDVTIRDRVAAKWDADAKSWHDMSNAQQSDLDQVKLVCKDEYASVNAQMTGKCENNPVEAQK
ncbi:MAG: hypothetical protein QM831_05665 [Kofleriaceae bacterium]